MADKKKMELVEYLIEGLAKFHGEPNTAFYKELAGEIFVRYGEFEDVGEGYTTLSQFVGRSFQALKEKK